MVAELTALRDQIDEVDKALLGLLARRLALVAEVGEVKSQFGLPIYVPEREASMLASRRKEAETLGVPPDLIEDVLRRVMRESYSSENDKGFKTLCPTLRPVVIVGGAGQMGRLFEKMLTLSGYQVKILEKEDWAQAEEIVADAGMVIVSVPIHATEQIIHQLPTLPEDCILVDLASVKNGPLQAMLAAHKGPVLGLHPMFGPDSGSLAKQVVVCLGRTAAPHQRGGTRSEYGVYPGAAPLCDIRLWAASGGRERAAGAASRALIADLSSGTGHGGKTVCPGSATLCRHYHGLWQ